MNAKIRSMMEINAEAQAILIREMGVVDALRFLGQFRTGAGEYTKERGQWLDKLSLGEIVSEIKAKRRKARRSH